MVEISRKMSTAFACFLFMAIHGSFLEVLCQQESPLRGQTPLGPPPSNSNITDVYVSVLLSKLLSVDAVNYQFTLKMLVVMTWRDDRVDDLKDAMSTASMADQDQAVLDLKFCKENVSLTNSSLQDMESCQVASAAPSNWGSSCLKSCASHGGPLCCDLLWMPSLKFGNVVALPQDRELDERVYVIRGNTANGNEGIPGTGGVIRTVQVQATFTAAYLFQNFPFDDQKLVVDIESGYSSAGVNLISSGVSKGASGLFQNKQLKSDELPSWAVQSVNLNCTPSRSDYSIPDFKEQGLNPNDLLADVKETDLFSCTFSQPVATRCSFEVSIRRLSSYYLWNTLFPLICIVHIAFLPLFVSPHKLDLRMTTTVTLFLALTTLQFTTNAELPSSSYLTAYHKLVLVSYSILVAISVEFLLAYTASTWKSAMDLMGGTSRVRKRQSSELELSSEPMVNTHASENLLGVGGDKERGLDEIKEETLGTDHGSARSIEEDLERLWKPRRLMRTLNRKVSVKRLGAAIGMRHRMLRTDSTYGFRFARSLDRFSAVAFPLGYWIAILVIFL